MKQHKIFCLWWKKKIDAGITKAEVKNTIRKMHTYKRTKEKKSKLW
jgi:hypothetical protein